MSKIVGREGDMKWKRNVVAVGVLVGCWANLSFGATRISCLTALTEAQLKYEQAGGKIRPVDSFRSRAHGVFSSDAQVAVVHASISSTKSSLHQFWVWKAGEQRVYPFKRRLLYHLDGLALSADANSLAILYEGGDVEIVPIGNKWSWRSKKLPAHTSDSSGASHDRGLAPPVPLSFSPSGDCLLKTKVGNLRDSESCVFVWDVISASAPRRVGHQAFCAAPFLHRDRFITVNGGEAIINNPPRSVGEERSFPLSGHFEKNSLSSEVSPVITSMEVSPEDRWLATTSNSEPVVRLWNLSEGGKPGPFARLILRNGYQGVYDAQVLGFSPDNRMVFVWSNNYQDDRSSGFFVLDIAQDGSSLTLRHAFQLHTGRMTPRIAIFPGMAFPGDNRALVALQFDEGNLILDVQHGEVLQTIQQTIRPADSSQYLTHGSFWGVSFGRTNVHQHELHTIWLPLGGFGRGETAAMIRAPLFQGWNMKKHFPMPDDTTKDWGWQRESSAGG